MFMQMLVLLQEWYGWFVCFCMVRESFHWHGLYHNPKNNWQWQKFGRLFLEKRDAKHKCQEASFVNIKAASTETQFSVLLLVDNAQLKLFYLPLLSKKKASPLKYN